MPLRILAGVTALALFVAYFAPIVFRLREVPLAVVVVGGLALAAVDLYESLRER